jgi:hypothetical protein
MKINLFKKGAVCNWDVCNLSKIIKVDFILRKTPNYYPPHAFINLYESKYEVDL